MMDFLTGMMKLPLTAMTTGMELFTQTARGVGKLAGEGLSYVGAGTADSKAEQPKAARTAAPRVRLGDAGVKLVEYVLVDLAPDHERIVDRGHRVIRAPTTEDRLSTELIAAFVGSPRGAGHHAADLRAHIEILESWSA